MSRQHSAALSRPQQAHHASPLLSCCVSAAGIITKGYNGYVGYAGGPRGCSGAGAAPPSLGKGEEKVAKGGHVGSGGRGALQHRNSNQFRSGRGRKGMTHDPMCIALRCVACVTRRLYRESSRPRESSRKHQQGVTAVRLSACTARPNSGCGRAGWFRWVFGACCEAGHDVVVPNPARPGGGGGGGPKWPFSGPGCRGGGLTGSTGGGDRACTVPLHVADNPSRYQRRGRFMRRAVLPRATVSHVEEQSSLLWMTEEPVVRQNRNKPPVWTPRQPHNSYPGLHLLRTRFVWSFGVFSPPRTKLATPMTSWLGVDRPPESWSFYYSEICNMSLNCLNPHCLVAVTFKIT